MFVSEGPHFQATSLGTRTDRVKPQVQWNIQRLMINGPADGHFGLGLPERESTGVRPGVGGASAECQHSDIHPYLNGPRKIFIMAIHEGR